MTDYGSTRLPRYDWNTLQPIRQRLPINGGTLNGWRSYSRRPLGMDVYNSAVPRVYPSWPIAPSPLAVEPVAPRPITPLAVDPHGTVRTLKTPYVTPLPVDGTLNGHPTSHFNGTPVGVVATSPAPVKFDWEERLFENYHVGVHRVIFLLRKFPALAALIASIWVLYGRHEAAKFQIYTHERNQNLTVFVTTLFSLIGIAFGVRNHANQHKSALSQIVYRLGSLTTSLFGEVTAFIFGLIAIIKLGQIKPTDVDSCNQQECFALDDRIVQSGIQLGLTLLSAILTIISIFHGIRAIWRIFYDRKLQKRAARRNIATYSNPLATKAEPLY
ncbi:hypothetical protein M3Y99_01755800 [Aphelenchoides fujianensis]|nr:hypothetical protein M3Y99_01755800 [Aphelenchoides fujianensis]